MKWGIGTRVNNQLICETRGSQIESSPAPDSSSFDISAFLDIKSEEYFWYALVEYRIYMVGPFSKSWWNFCSMN